MTKRPLMERLKVGMTTMLLWIAFYIFVPGFFAGVEKGLLPWKYAFRGESEVDSSVVIIALTGDDIDALGGLPIKRSYYALAVSALTDLGAGTIGIDLGLTAFAYQSDGIAISAPQFARRSEKKMRRRQLQKTA